MDVRHVIDLYPMVGNYKVTIGFVWWKTKRNTFIFSLIQQNADTSSIYSLFLSQPLPPLSISSSGGVLQPSPSVSVSSSPHLPPNQLFSLLPLLNIFNQLNEIGLVIINKNSSSPLLQINSISNIGLTLIFPLPFDCRSNMKLLPIVCGVEGMNNGVDGRRWWDDRRWRGEAAEE
jgi:hypothetical protein